MNVLLEALGLPMFPNVVDRPEERSGSQSSALPLTYNRKWPRGREYAEHSICLSCQNREETLYLILTSASVQQQLGLYGKTLETSVSMCIILYKLEQIAGSIPWVRTSCLPN